MHIPTSFEQIDTLDERVEHEKLINCTLHTNLSLHSQVYLGKFPLVIVLIVISRFSCLEFISRVLTITSQVLLETNDYFEIGTWSYG